jgi:hypothetical protein
VLLLNHTLHASVDALIFAGRNGQFPPPLLRHISINQRSTSVSSNNHGSNHGNNGNQNTTFSYITTNDYCKA